MKAERAQALARDRAKLRHLMRSGINLDRALSPAAVRVGSLLLDYLNQHTGEAWPGAETLAGKTGYSLRTVRRAIVELTAADGWFEVLHGRGRSRSNRYRPRFVRLGEQAEVTARACFGGSKKVTGSSAKGDNPVLEKVTPVSPKHEDTLESETAPEQRAARPSRGAFTLASALHAGLSRSRRG